VALYISGRTWLRPSGGLVQSKDRTGCFMYCRADLDSNALSLYQVSDLVTLPHHRPGAPATARAPWMEL